MFVCVSGFDQLVSLHSLVILYHIKSVKVSCPPYLIHQVVNIVRSVSLILVGMLSALNNRGGMVRR